MVIETTVDAGACGFTTQVKASCEDGQIVQIEIASRCENIERLASHLREVDAYEEIGAGFDGAIHQAAVKTLRGCCSGCAVPIGLFKSMQAAAGLALPVPVSMSLRVDQT